MDLIKPNDPLAGLEVEFQNGELVVVGERTKEADPEETPDTTVDDTPTEPTQDKYEPRFKALETRFDQVVNLLLAQANGTNKPAAPAESSDIDLSDVTDVKGLVEGIKTQVKSLIETNLKSVQSDMREIKLQNEFSNIAAQHGERFTKNTNAVAKLMESVPGLSLTKAWEAVESTLPKAESTVTPKKPASNQQDVINRAKQVKLDSSEGTNNGTTINKTKEIKTIADAVDAAFQQLMS